MRQTITINQTNKTDEANSNYKLNGQGSQGKQRPQAKQGKQSTQVYSNHKSAKIERHIIFISFRSRYFRKRLTFKQYTLNQKSW